MSQTPGFATPRILRSSFSDHPKSGMEFVTPNTLASRPFGMPYTPMRPGAGYVQLGPLVANRPRLGAFSNAGPPGRAIR